MTRALLVTLWICLLPVRGWAGDLMAIESGSHGTQPAMAAAAQDCHDVHGHPADSADADVAQASSHDRMHADGECSDCTGCEICHAHAMTPRAVTAQLFPLAGTVPRTPVTQRTSTVLSPGLRPPIG